MMTSWGGHISPHGAVPRKGLRRWWLPAEVNLDGSLSVDLGSPAVAIGRYDGQRILERHAARDLAKARAKPHRAHVGQARPFGPGERSFGVAQLVGHRIEVRGARHIGRADADRGLEIDAHQRVPADRVAPSQLET